MKTLKLFRALSMAGGLTCFMISCLPDIKSENSYDWMMIAAVVNVHAATILLQLTYSSPIKSKSQSNRKETTTYTSISTNEAVRQYFNAFILIPDLNFQPRRLFLRYRI